MIEKVIKINRMIKEFVQKSDDQSKLNLFRKLSHVLEKIMSNAKCREY
jgi:hypothetical protein